VEASLRGGPLLWGSEPSTSGMVSPDLNILVNDPGWLYSEEDLTIADIGEGLRFECGLRERPGCCGCQRGPRVECGLWARPEALSLDRQWASWYVEFIICLRRFWCCGTRATILMRVKI